MIIIVPVSGGKDSQKCLALALDSHPKTSIRAVHQWTGYDHPLTYAHMKYMERHYGVKIEFTRNFNRWDNIFDFIRGAGYFPNNAARGCTKELKQKPFAQWLLANKLTGAGVSQIWMGMRREESRARNEKYAGLSPDDIFTLTDINPSAYPPKKFATVEMRLPIVDESVEQVFSFLKKRGDRVNELYKKGHDRVGCYPCMLSKREEWVRAMKDPVGRKHISELLKIEQEFKDNKNPRKLIRIHENRDVKFLYDHGRFPDKKKDDSAECGWCSI